MLREQKEKELCTALMEEKWMLRSTLMLNQNYHFNKVTLMHRVKRWNCGH